MVGLLRDPARLAGAALLLALLAAERQPPGLRAQPAPPLQVGEDYGVARRRLLSLGWRLRSRPAGAECSVLPGDRRCFLYPELASCAPTGLGLCRFEWLSPAGSGYAVITREGSPEGPPGRIDRWFPSR